jgi:hypothetical protein
MFRPLYHQYKTVGQCLRGVVTPIYQQHGFFTAELILDWEKIVGPQFAVCKPVRVSRGARKGGGCTLYVSSPPAVASQMLYLVPVILERIRMYLGENIVSNIMFVR